MKPQKKKRKKRIDYANKQDGATASVSILVINIPYWAEGANRQLPSLKPVKKIISRR